MPVRKDTATLANVASSITSVTLLAANANRLGAVIVNDSTSVLYVKYGSAAAATDFTYLVAAGATLELLRGVIYTGIITGIWVTANGFARVTQLVI